MVGRKPLKFRGHLLATKRVIFLGSTIGHNELSVEEKQWQKYWTICTM